MFKSHNFSLFVSHSFSLLSASAFDSTSLSSRYFSYQLIFFFLWLLSTACGILIPSQGMETQSQWKCRVLTTEHLGTSPLISSYFLMFSSFPALFFFLLFTMLWSIYPSLSSSTATAVVVLVPSVWHYQTLGFSSFCSVSPSHCRKQSKTNQNKQKKTKL